MKFRFSIPIILFLTLLSGLLLYHQKTRDSRIFHRLTADYFKASLADDALSLHYTLADSSDYFKENHKASLPVYSRKKQQQSILLIQELLSGLRLISPEKLSDRDQYTYSLLIPWLENELTGAKYPYYHEPLSPTSGIHTELPVLLAEYTFYNKKDVEDYLNILESIPDYLSGLAEYEREKADAGLFMTQEDAAAVVEQCDRILDPVLLETGEHFLQTTFSNRLDELITEKLLDPDEKPALIAENNRLLSGVAAPAYTSLADQIFLLSGSDTFQGSICQQKGGSGYYLYLLKRNTGSSRTPQEIESLLTCQLQELYTDLQSSLQKYQTLTGALPKNDGFIFSTFPLQTPVTILKDLQLRIKKDFPDLAEHTFCRIKSVDPEMEAYTSPAFYLVPPVDHLTENVIYINKSSTVPGLDLYTTIAHEGYPGHLYQTVYSQSYENSKTSNPIRSLLYHGGFVEGWAYYAENMAFDYAADLLAENNFSPEDQLLVHIACLERNLQINLYCLLDLAIHCSGASIEDVHNILSRFGITDSETSADIYHYIRLEPVTYLKYYLGYLELLDLKKKAQELWQESYTPLLFHTFLLESGPSDFDNLKLRLESYEVNTAEKSGEPIIRSSDFSAFLQNN